MPRPSAADTRLSSSLTIDEFDRGYWYATELTRLATRIGIPHGTRLRKDELERAIRMFLTSGRITRPKGRPASKPGMRDVERGLRMVRGVVVYTNDKETKAFLEAQARRIDPEFRRRSGASYRLNRWREEQLARGRRITYGDLVQEYVRAIGVHRHDDHPERPSITQAHGTEVAQVARGDAAKPQLE